MIYRTEGILEIRHKTEIWAKKECLSLGFEAVSVGFCFGFYI